MSALRIRPVWVVHAIALALLGYWLYGTPNVTYRSSDGKWADAEVLFKGRDLRQIATQFEDYKLKCRAPSATMLRATPIRWINIFAWPNYVHDPKWRIPYSNAHPEIGDYYPSATATDCYNRGSSDKELEMASENADRFMRDLSAKRIHLTRPLPR